MAEDTPAFVEEAATSALDARPRWGSRRRFVAAAIGSAVGLGNLWRFPYYVLRYGGGPFLLPYVLALVVVGIPLLVLEFALGQVVMGGDVVCFGVLHRRLRGVGVAGAYTAFVIVTYYVAIIAISVFYLVMSFSPALPWMAQGAALAGTGGGREEAAVANNEQASKFWTDDVLHLAADPDSPGLIAAGNLLAALVVVWLCIFMIIYRGVISVSNVVFWTVGLPCATLLVLIVAAASLEGSLEGIKAYIGVWDWTQLQVASTWASATSQIFFSIGICHGIMTAYASYNGRRMSAVKDAIIVSCFNSMYSFFAGFAVFGVLGNLAVSAGSSVNDVANAGPSLAFKTYPVALGNLPQGARQFFSIVFFSTLIFLGIDSAFSLCEAATTVIKDARSTHIMPTQLIAAITTLVGLCASLLYVSDIGLYVLDVVDHYVNSFLIIGIGILHAVAAGWTYRRQDVARAIGVRGSFALACVEAGWLSAAIVGNGIGFGILADATALSAFPGGGPVLGAVLALLLIVIGTSAGLALALLGKDAAQQGTTAAQRARLLLMGPVDRVVEDLNAGIEQMYDPSIQGVPWRIPQAWSIAVKFVIPSILSLVFSSNLNDLIRVGGFYGGYSMGYQAFGCAIVLLGFSFVVLGLVAPHAYDGLWPAHLDADQRNARLEALLLKPGARGASEA